MDAKKKRNILINTLVYAGSVIGALLFITFVAQFVTVNGHSMEPNLSDGDRLIIQKLSKDYAPGDIVVIKDVLDRPIIKRVVAVENQTVDFQDNELVVNGKTIPGSVYNIKNNITTLSPEDSAKFPLTVPDGHVFVLGDNREHSTDSRCADIGPIENEKIMGKLWLKFWPPE